MFVFGFVPVDVADSRKGACLIVGIVLCRSQGTITIGRRCLNEQKAKNMHSFSLTFVVAVAFSLPLSLSLALPLFLYRCLITKLFRQNRNKKFCFVYRDLKKKNMNETRKKPKSSS